MDIFLRNIRIKRIDNEDLFYMPAAQFQFSINAQEFSYIDYIDPFFNIITPFLIKRTTRTSGDTKKNLVLDIMNVFNVDLDEAKIIFKSTTLQLNSYISKHKELRAKFPTFSDLLIKMYQHDFIDQCEFNFNFIQTRTNVERHIRYKTIRDAMHQLDDYIANGETQEEYTFEYVKGECEEYDGLFLEHNNTEHNTGYYKDKPYVVFLEAFEKRERTWFFDSLRDVIWALPLDGFDDFVKVFEKDVY